MKSLIRLFHFLGGIYFAIFLIAITTLLVIGGTVIEAKTGSHLYAAHWTYHHPLFAFLLWLFFINILFSALRRWPFRWHHIPFLMTHLGLLMIIAGTIIKNRYGLQGNLSVVEGSGNQQVLIPYTQALHIEKRDPSDPTQILAYDYPLIFQNRQSDPASLPQLSWKVVGYAPHVHEKLESWIKGNWAYIQGHPPIPVQQWKRGEPLLIEAKSSFKSYRDSPSWDLLALRTEDINEAIQSAYLHGSTIKFYPREERRESETIYSFPLGELINERHILLGSQIQCHLQFVFSPIHGLKNPCIDIVIETDPKSKSYEEQIYIPLQGHQALYTQVRSPSWQIAPRFDVEVERTPLLLLIEDSQGEPYLVAFDAHGRVHAQSLRSSTQILAVYDQGFGGYTAQATIPFPTFPATRQVKQQADLYDLSLKLAPAIQSAPVLAPPLAFLKEASDSLSSVDLTHLFLQFLYQWHQSGQILFTPSGLTDPLFIQTLQRLEWNKIPRSHQQACLWIDRLIEHLEHPLKEGEDVIQFLAKNKWPFISSVLHDSTQTGKQLWTLLAQQIFSVVSQLPYIPEEINSLSLEKQTRLLSAYFLSFGIQYHQLQPSSKGEIGSGTEARTEEEEEFSKIENYYTSLAERPEDQVKGEKRIVLEAPLTTKHQVEHPSKKWEDHLPGVIVELTYRHQKQVISLAYDPSATGLKWPIFNGEFLIRFQPQKIEIPYRIRLRQARQLNYADTNQPYSYESDVLIGRQVNGQDEAIEKTLSMNHVHETWDGYRFYLGGMSTLESGIKRIQLVVNRDPAKYYLTYPGGVLVSLGALLLFWMRPYRWMRKTKRH